MIFQQNTNASLRDEKVKKLLLTHW